MPPGPAASTTTTAQTQRGLTTRALNRSIQPLNVSTISQSGPPPPIKHLANGGPRINCNNNINNINGGPSMLNTTPLTSISSSNHCNQSNINLSTKHRVGAREALTSLGLLCLGKLILEILFIFFSFLNDLT